MSPGHGLLALGVVAGVAWLVWRWRRVPEGRIVAELDRVLAADSAALRDATADSDPLRFATVERVPVSGLGFGWGVRSGRVHLVRVIRAATPRSYRLRLRAFAPVIGGRVIVRSIDVDVPRRREKRCR